MSDSSDSYPMLDLYQQEIETHCAVLKREVSSLRKDESVQSEPIMRAAHSIKGAARIVGIQPIGDLTGALESLGADLGDAHTAVLGKHLDLLESVIGLVEKSAQVEASDMSDWLGAIAAEADAMAKKLSDIKPEEIADNQPTAEPEKTKAISPASEPANLADASMLELFRTEASDQLEKLSTGLVELETDAGDLSQIEILMRAAHSMKGAARIVGLTAAVDVAHVMEDALVAAQAGEVTLDPESVDVLLRATDFLNSMASADDTEMATWADDYAEEIQCFKSDLKAIKEGTYEPKGHRPGASVTAKAKEGLSEEKKSAVTTAESSRKEVTGMDSVVRVSAESLNRLMGLAAETLVETRKLSPFRDTLLKLKETQVELNHRLDTAQQAIEDAHLDPALETEFELVRGAARSSLDAIRRQIDFFDGFSRSHTLLSDRLYREVLESRMRPFRDGTVGFPRLVRDIARSLGKKVSLELEGKETPVDRDVLEKLDAPLNHILRNACDHGFELPEERLAAGKSETGTLKLSARHSAGMLVLEVRDDGRGIDVKRIREKVLERELCAQEMADNLSEDEVLEFLFLPGFSTASSVTEISGRGVGLDVVQTMMQEIGGQVRVSTEVGLGTTFTIEVPITRSVVRALIVDIDSEPYAFPLNRISRTLQLRADDIRILESRQYFDMDGINVGLVSAHAALGLTGVFSSLSKELTVVVVNDRNTLYGVEVDRLIGESDLVVRPLDPRLGKVPGIGSASLTESGEPLLIIDTEDLVKSIDKLLSGGALVKTERRDVRSGLRKKRVLVVDDSITVRATEQQLLENAGYEVDVAVDGADGWNAIRLGDFDLVVSDIDMPRLNGFELVAKIRADNRLSRIPIIIVSYKDREEDRMKGLEAGADFYLTKSAFQDDTFIEAIEDLIGGPEDS